MKKITLLLAGSALLLSGCAGVKSSFDCDATTSDTCMTMTKANQLARDKAAKQAGKPAAGGLPSLVNLPATSAVGIPSASRSAVNPPSGTRTVSTTPPRICRHVRRCKHKHDNVNTDAPSGCRNAGHNHPVISGLPSGRLCGHTDTVMPERAL
nr:TraV family lipoprotein [Salmonella enterica]